MILDVNTTSAKVALVDLTGLRRFHVAVSGPAQGELTGVDALVREFGAGRVDGDEVLIAISWIREQADRAGIATSEWNDSFDAMVDYSASRGWVEENTSVFRVHCEWPNSATTNTVTPIKSEGEVS